MDEQRGTGMNNKQDDKTRTLLVTEQTGKSRDRLTAEMALGSASNNASLAVLFSSTGELSITDCLAVIGEKAKAVHGGDMRHVEIMLVSQSIALDAIFSSMAIRAKTNMGHYVDTADKYMKLALRAQSQCRATLETLAEIKNPRPVAFIGQQNIAGNQQVNNGGQQKPKNELSDQNAHAHVRAGEKSKSTNGLLTNGGQDHEIVDFGRTATAGGTHQEMEALGTIDRAED